MAGEASTRATCSPISRSGWITLWAPTLSRTFAWSLVVARATIMGTLSSFRFAVVRMPASRWFSPMTTAAAPKGAAVGRRPRHERARPELFQVRRREDAGLQVVLADDDGRRVEVVDVKAPQDVLVR